jgi:hypothetical protein
MRLVGRRPLTFSLIMALVLAAAMLVNAVTTWFFHDRKHQDLDRWVDYGFSRDTLRHALIYYRFMGISMLVFLVLFVVSCLLLQADGHNLFMDERRGGNLVSGGLIAVTFFALDLVLRGAFFDVMEHFELAVTHLHMNRASRGFVWYCFAFRMYYGLVLLRILVSFVWIWTKIAAARRGQRSTIPGTVQRPGE